jgi:hypothetical protein
MKRSLFTFAAITGLLLFRPNAQAWDGAGHLVIAAEAFRQLPPEMQAAVVEVLQAHPDFADWKQGYHPNANINLAAYVFLRSSNWPDEIKGSHSRYDHPNWHFIDYPLRAPDFAVTPDAAPTNNVLFGIAQCEQGLADAAATPEWRAVCLSYLVHLVGDLHQPLHCESFYSPAYPDGDRGGNSIYVNPWPKEQNRPNGTRLHGLWDGLLGEATDTQTQWQYAETLAARFPRATLPELAAHTTLKEWSLESRTLALEKGYLHGRLAGSPEAAGAPQLPDGYLAAAQGAAERQAALAGCRLADEIRKCLKPSATALAPEYTRLDPNAVMKRIIGTAEAAGYYDETMVVTGRVAAVSARSSITILNLDQAGPAAPFSAVVFAENAGVFGDLEKFKNQPVEVHGSITKFHQHPEMILTEPGQLKVLAGPAQ